MKQKTLTTMLWLLLLYLTLEANIAAYNYVFFPILDPVSGEINFGNSINDFIVLSFNFFIFFIAGAILAWRITEQNISIIFSMAIGIISLSLDISMSIPWFQLMPAHPTNYDHILAFIGSANPPIACALGAYLYCRLIKYTINEKTT